MSAGRARRTISTEYDFTLSSLIVKLQLGRRSPLAVGVYRPVPRRADGGAIIARPATVNPRRDHPVFCCVGAAKSAIAVYPGDKLDVVALTNMSADMNLAVLDDIAAHFFQIGRDPMRGDARAMQLRFAAKASPAGANRGFAT